MQMVYKAFDGKIFESEKECADYEAKTTSPVKYYFKGDFHVATPQEEREFMEESECIFVPASEFKVFKSKMRKFGLRCPKSEGLWFWDEKKSDWATVDAVRGRLVTKIRELDKIKALTKYF